jgi:glycosyltransferase involved in cell wall biosynthesis
MQLTERQLPVVIVGSAVGAAPIEDRLRQLSTERPNVRWLGHISDQDLLNQLWAHCGLYLHGHSVGGTNPSLLQALGAGSPTCVFNTPYNIEVVRDECPVFDDSPDKLARVVDDLMARPDYRRVLSELGQKIVRKRYTWDVVLAQYRDLLYELAERQPLPASND